MPLFNGVDIFGTASVAIPRPEPNDLQVTAYPGINGIDVLNLGSRGATVDVGGLLIAPDLATLAAYENVWWALQRNATVGVLVGSRGETYPHAQVLSFEPTEEIKPFFTTGTLYLVSMAYRAKLLILD